MTGTANNSEGLDERRRKISFRAWHRGMREMDLVLGQYVDAYIAKMSDQDLDLLEYIMSFEDRDLLTWVTGEVPIPDDVDTPLFRDILDHRVRLFANKAEA